MLTLVVALGLLVALAGCGDDESSTDGPDATDTTSGPGDTEPAPVTEEVTVEALDGRTFVSQQVEGYDLVDGSAINLSFDGDMLGANAGCNQMTSSYELDATTLRWSGTPAATMMACEDALMTQDQWLAELLTAGAQARLEANTLTLSADAVTITLLDESEASPDQPIVGTVWTLDSVITGETVASVPTDVGPPTLTFTEDARVEVYAGCNRGSGGAEVAADGSTITFEPIATTRMACSPDAMDLEASVLAVLDGEVAAEVDGGSLTLTKGDAGLVYRAG
jgi:heat shock protein HslJ